MTVVGSCQDAVVNNIIHIVAFHLFLRQSISLSLFVFRGIDQIVYIYNFDCRRSFMTYVKRQGYVRLYKYICMYIHTYIRTNIYM